MRRVSDDPYFSAPDWRHPSQSIAVNMRQRSAASSRVDQIKMKAEQKTVNNLREIFMGKQRDYDSLEARAADYQARIAALEAQLAELSSDLQAVTKDVAVAGDDLLGADDVREGRVDAAASNGGDAADDVAADDAPAVQRHVLGHAEEHSVPRRSEDGAGGPAAAPDDSGGGEGAGPIPPVPDGDDAAAAEMK